MKKNVIKVFTAILLPFVSVLSLWAVTIPDVGYSDIVFGTESGTDAIGLTPGTLRSTSLQSTSCPEGKFGSAYDLALAFCNKYTGKIPESDITDKTGELMRDCLNSGCERSECFAYSTDFFNSVELITGNPHLAPVSTDVALMALFAGAYLAFAVWRKKRSMAKI